MQNDFIYCLYVFVCVNNVICSQVELSFFFHAYNHFNYFTTDTLFYGLTDVLLSSGRLASLVILAWSHFICRHNLSSVLLFMVLFKLFSFCYEFVLF